MDLVITIGALALLMLAAYRGYSVILFAPIAAQTAGISPEVLHRVASMASGGMDTLPHNGAVITLLAVTGLTHRQAYGSIFVLTGIKSLSVFVVIGVYYLTGWV